MESTKGKGYIIYEAASLDVTPTMISQEQNVVRFNAQLQEAEKPNRNRRIYSKDAIDSAIKFYAIQEKLQNKALYGESGHPLSDDPKRQLYIDQRNISHIINKLWWEGNKLMGNVETADTLAGHDMRGLILQGSKVAFSMRGMSDNVRSEGEYSRVGKPLMIVTWDWVIIPSHPGSYIMTESADGSAKPATDEESVKILKEGLLTPYNAKEMLNYAVNASRNVNDMIKAYNFSVKEDLSNVSIDKQKQIMSIKEGTDTLRIFLESNIQKDLNKFYDSFLLA